MKIDRMLTLAFVSILGLIFLTGCVDIESIDQRWLARALNDPSDNVDFSSFNWIVAGLLLIFFIFSSYAFLTKDWVGAIHWLIFMTVGIASVFRITELILAAGEWAWPDDYKMSTVMELMGWQIPFPEDAVWTSPVAYAFTDFIPSVINVWLWGLWIVHLISLVVIAISRNIKPIVVDLAFIGGWLITSPILFSWTQVSANAKAEATSKATKAVIELLLYAGGVWVLMALFMSLIPIAVAVFAIFVSWGKYDLSWKKNKDEASVIAEAVKKLTGKVDADALVAFFAGLGIKAKPPIREENGGDGTEGAVGPQAQGTEGDGPEGPTEGLEPSLTEDGVETGKPDSSQEEDGAIVGETTGLPADDVGVQTASAPVDLDTPSSEDESDDDSSDQVPKEKGGEVESEESRVKRTASRVGRAAKAAAPVVGAVRPEAAVALGVVGGLLAPDDNASDDNQGDGGHKKGSWKIKASKPKSENDEEKEDLDEEVT